MNPTLPLTGSHLRTYQKIIQRPTSRNLGWHAVRGLMARLAHLVEEANGNLRMTRNGETMVLHPPRTKDVADPDELMALRHFLERSEPAAPEPKPGGAEWLVVIDPCEARIYRSASPDAGAQRIRPHGPEDSFPHALNSKYFARGQEKPDPKRFFEPVAGVLNGAGKILIFGSSTGTSSEMDQFAAWLKTHRPELAKRVVGAVVVDEDHLTESEILAQAREFYAGLARLAPR